VLHNARKDRTQGRVVRAWLADDVLGVFAEHILPVDEVVARQAAGFHLPFTAPENDAYIAATALVHGMSLVTRNVKDFVRFPGIDIVNPWDPAR
jgi:predicted nucleic acid-binding protein